MNSESSNENVGIGSTSIDPQDLKVNLDPDTLRKVMKDYKKIKKYMRSSIFAVKQMDGNEKVVTKLLKNIEDVEM